MTRRRTVTLVLGMLTLALSFADPTTLSAQTGGPIFNGTDLTGWKVESTKAGVSDGVLHVGSGNGWVRTERTYADFVLQLDVRLEGKGEAGFFVRAWPTFDSTSTPNNGYRFRFSNPKPATDWMRVEVECAGRTLTVRSTALSCTLRTSFRTRRVTWRSGAPIKPHSSRPSKSARARPLLDGPPGVVIAGAAAISNPQPVGPRPTPRYTSDAMRARIEGTVALAVTVQPDGTIGDVRVLQSLDPTYGLDAAAVATAQSWRFTPGTRAGEPVPVRVMIEFEFNLR